jgi:hypothetical protein
MATKAHEQHLSTFVTTATVLKDKMKSLFHGVRPAATTDTTPWKVEDVAIFGDRLAVTVMDRNHDQKTFAVPRKNLKMIQYVGDAFDKGRTLYAELRGAPKGVAFGPPHRIVYLGQIERNAFDDLQTQLDKNGIDWFWYPSPRKEKPSDLLPDDVT